MPLVTMQELFETTKAERWGIGMFNVGNLEFAAAVIEAAEELKAPVMIGLPERFFQYIDMETISRLCVDMAKRSRVPVVVHLDHGKTYDVIVKALRFGFSSVMFDGSSLPYDENVKKTSEIVHMAHVVGVSVEGELGYIGRAGVDNAMVEYDKSLFTKPEQAMDFVERTGVDALAIAIGNLHGIYRGIPQLDFDRLKQIRDKVKAGLVLHGGSGLSEDDFRKAVKLGIDKVNIYTELSVFAMNHVAEALPNSKEWLDVSKSLRLGLKEFIKGRISVLGGAGKA